MLRTMKAYFRILGIDLEVADTWVRVAGWLGEYSRLLQHSTEEIYFCERVSEISRVSLAFQVISSKKFSRQQHIEIERTQ
jgi:hypothetical protein